LQGQDSLRLPAFFAIAGRRPYPTAHAPFRWISARRHGNDAEIADRVMFGIFLEVTGRKQA
jgi:hypothetical protein